MSAKDAFRLIDDQIRVGNFRQAGENFSRIRASELSDDLVAEYARLACRLSRPTTGISVLRRRFSRPSFLNEDESNKLASYAYCLIRIGAIPEGKGILQKILNENCPRTFFYQACAFMGSWDYANAIPFLRRFIKSTNDKYEQLVGKVNLAACLLAEFHLDESTNLLRRILYETSIRKHRLLLSNALEISAQNFFFRKDYEETRKCLNRARRILRGNPSGESLWIDKWRAFLFLREHKGVRADTIESEMRIKAKKNQDWETLRDLDRYVAVFRQDELRLLNVCFGTPFESFRIQSLRLFDNAIRLPNSWIFSSGRANEPIFDLEKGTFDAGGPKLKKLQCLHRTIRVLACDRYRPFRIPHLFAEIFQNEFFNPVSSPARVHQAIKRLNVWSRKYSIGLHVLETQSTYQLENRTFGIRIARGIEPQASMPFASLRREFSDSPFSISDMSKSLGMARRTCQRFLSQAVTMGLLTVVGKGSRTKYTFSRK